jgi:hypothetical protein
MSLMSLMSLMSVIKVLRDHCHIIYSFTSWNNKRDEFVHGIQSDKMLEKRDLIWKFY